MKFVVLALIITFATVYSFAQPAYLQQLEKRYEIENGFKTTVNIKIDVPGIVAPPKIVSIYAENGKKPKIKGDGLILLPKKGFVRQFDEILTIPVHWIFLNSDDTFESYKLVSLDPKSDWITADLKLLIAYPRIEEVNIATRKAGEFFIKHSYGNRNYPVKSEISFVSDRLNIPLKFMGKSDFSSVKDSTGHVSGKIILEFEEFEVF